MNYFDTQKRNDLRQKYNIDDVEFADLINDITDILGDSPCITKSSLGCLRDDLDNAGIDNDINPLYPDGGDDAMIATGYSLNLHSADFPNRDVDILNDIAGTDEIYHAEDPNGRIRQVSDKEYQKIQHDLLKQIPNDLIHYAGI